MGPFSPPPDYCFEPELHGPPPRPIPDSIREGHVEKLRRTGLRHCIQMAMGIVVIWLLCVWLQWIQRFPALRYLVWVSVPFFAIGAWHMVRRLFVLGPYRYIQDGVPLVARIVELVKAPTVYINGEPSSYAITALIECVDPRNGQQSFVSMKSRGFASSQEYTTSFTVGDYLTAVYLPDSFPKSLQLYAFLDLTPSQGLVRSPAVAQAGRRWLKGTMTALGAVAIFTLALWNVYAITYYNPIDMSLQMLWPVALGGIVLGGGILIGMASEHRRRRRERDEANRAALASGTPLNVGHLDLWDRPGVRGRVMRVVVVAGSLLIGGVTVLCWAMSVNAICDTSPPQPTEVVVTKAVKRTYLHLWGHYVIEYSMPGSSGSHDFCCSVRNIEIVCLGPAEAEVHAGRLGWPWVKAVRSPVVKVPAGLGPANAPLGRQAD